MRCNRDRFETTLSTNAPKHTADSHEHALAAGNATEESPTLPYRSDDSNVVKMNATIFILMYSSVSRSPADAADADTDAADADMDAADGDGAAI